MDEPSRRAAWATRIAAGSRSGHTAEILAPHNLLGPDLHFLQKPFSRAELTAQIRAALGA